MELGGDAAELGTVLFMSPTKVDPIYRNVKASPWKNFLGKNKEL